MTGVSRAQVARLIQCYQQGGAVKRRLYRRHHFPNRCTPTDIEFLAAVDEVHETLSGQATQKILQRELHLRVDIRGTGRHCFLSNVTGLPMYNQKSNALSASVE